VVKESNPLEVAEYAISNNIDGEPAFSWWVPNAVRNRDAIISAMKVRSNSRTHKFGIRIPMSVREALEIDRSNGNTLWEDAIQKEMTNVRVAFRILDDDQKIPPGYQYMECHLVFDVKFDGFKYKARMVAGGHMIDTPPFLTYASVVARDTDKDSTYRGGVTRSGGESG
jgi:hypothetical protein